MNLLGLILTFDFLFHIVPESVDHLALVLLVHPEEGCRSVVARSECDQVVFHQRKNLGVLEDKFISLVLNGKLEALCVITFEENTTCVLRAQDTKHLSTFISSSMGIKGLLPHVANECVLRTIQAVKGNPRVIYQNQGKNAI
jgi:hypothetical protein